MKILIIGGNGYIGNNLYYYLVQEGYSVDSVDLCLFDDNLGYSIVEDYDNYDISRYSHIILLAAHSSVNMAEYNKLNSYDNNVNKFIRLCSRLNNEQILIYASSASVYGGGTINNLFTEDHINLYPINQYDLTKILTDIIANKFIIEGKKIIGLRFGTLNGTFSGKNTRSDLMINSMFYSAITDKNIKIKNPEICRPILHMVDCINYIKHFVQNPFNFGQYNIVSFNSTVENIANICAKQLNVPVIYLMNDSPNKRYDFCLDNSKILQETNRDTINSSFIISDILNTLKTNINFSRRDDDIQYSKLQGGINC